MHGLTEDIETIRGCYDSTLEESYIITLSFELIAELKLKREIKNKLFLTIRKSLILTAHFIQENQALKLTFYPYLFIHVLSLEIGALSRRMKEVSKGFYPNFSPQRLR